MDPELIRRWVNTGLYATCLYLRAGDVDEALDEYIAVTRMPNSEFWDWERRVYGGLSPYGQMVTAEQLDAMVDQWHPAMYVRPFLIERSP